MWTLTSLIDFSNSTLFSPVTTCFFFYFRNVRNKVLYYTNCYAFSNFSRHREQQISVRMSISYSVIRTVLNFAINTDEGILLWFMPAISGLNRRWTKISDSFCNFRALLRQGEWHRSSTGKTANAKTFEGNKPQDKTPPETPRQRILTLNIPSLARQRCLPSWDPPRTKWFFCNFSTVWCR